MAGSGADQIDRIVFDSGSVRLGAFRCHPSHSSFHDSGPASNYCFVFPRTAVEIRHEHEPAFVANPNVVTFYNRGQSYVRNAISADGDRCDWFGVEADIALDAVRAFDPACESRPEMPFRMTRGWSDAKTYLAQRIVFDKVVSESAVEPLAIEESIIRLLESVVRSSYGSLGSRVIKKHWKPTNGAKKQHEIVRHIEFALSARLDERLTLRHLSREVGLSVFHMCRFFHRLTGTTLHAYRQGLRVRSSLENVADPATPLVDIALETGFSSHSHFTSTFRREFKHTPSMFRAQVRGEARGEGRARKRILNPRAIS